MQITVVFDSMEEFQKYVQPASTDTTNSVSPAVVEKPHRGRPKKQAVEPVETAEAPAEPETKKVTKTDVRAVALKLSKAGKSEELRAVFGQFGATKLSEVKEEDYAALIAALGEINA